MGTCPKCKKETLIEDVEVEVCSDDGCGYAFNYRMSPLDQPWSEID